MPARLVKGVTRQLPRLFHWRFRHACLTGVLAMFASFAVAATYDGITVPDSRIVEGTPLLLNGIGLRTASIFNVHVYVAALYVEHPSTDPEVILRSPDRKMLELHFVHDIDAIAARKAWQEGFNRTCRAPCQLPQPELAQFLATVPSVHPGDVARFVFRQDGLFVLLGNQQIGKVSDTNFIQVILAMFIGPAPASERLKQELLGRRG